MTVAKEQSTYWQSFIISSCVRICTGANFSTFSSKLQKHFVIFSSNVLTRSSSEPDTVSPKWFSTTKLLSFFSFGPFEGLGFLLEFSTSVTVWKSLKSFHSSLSNVASGASNCSSAILRPRILSTNWWPSPSQHKNWEEKRKKEMLQTSNNFPFNISRKNIIFPSFHSPLSLYLLLPLSKAKRRLLFSIKADLSCCK